MTEGKIRLRLRNVAYEHFEDEAGFESIVDSQVHGVDLGIRLSGEEGETFHIICLQMGDADWVEIFRTTEVAGEGVFKDMTRSPMWSTLVGDEVVVDLSAHRPRVLEMRGTKCSLYCWASGDNRIIVQRTRPDIPENISDSPREKTDHASESRTPSSPAVEALTKVGTFFALTLVLFVLVWPPWFLLLQDAARSAVVALSVAAGIVLLRALLLPHTEGIFVFLNALIVLAIAVFRWLS